MKRNDDLLRLAFGELSDDAARAVEASSDANERNEIEAFRELREGLRHLPPPPPDNLSAERLRAAILDRELASRRRSPLAWLPNLLVPAALAAVALAVFLPRLRTRPEPQIVTAMDDVRFTQPAERPRFDLYDFSKGAKPRADLVRPVQALTQVAPKRTTTRRRVRPHVDAPIVAPKPDAKDYLAMVVPSPDDTTPVAKLPVATKPQPETIAAPPSSVDEKATGIPAGAETVVIVSTKRDLETGAHAATEKEASSVLVGG